MDLVLSFQIIELIYHSSYVSLASRLDLIWNNHIMFIHIWPSISILAFCNLNLFILQTFPPVFVSQCYCFKTSVLNHIIVLWDSKSSKKKQNKEIDSCFLIIQFSHKLCDLVSLKSLINLLRLTRFESSINFCVVFTDSWSLQFEHGSRVCVIRSLLWLGLTFFHVPLTSQHGYIYMGDGIKNLDLPFMM